MFNTINNFSFFKNKTTKLNNYGKLPTFKFHTIYDITYFYSTFFILNFQKNKINKPVKYDYFRKKFNPNFEFKIINIFFNNDNKKFKVKKLISSLSIYYYSKLKIDLFKYFGYITIYNNYNVVFNFYKINIFKFFIKKFKDVNFNFKRFKKNIHCILKNIVYFEDLYSNNSFLQENIILYSNNYFFKNLIILNNTNQNNLNFKFFDQNNKKNFQLNFYNNYYPVFYSHKKSYNLFMSKFRSSLNINYLTFMNSYIMYFLENFFKNRFFLRISNNLFNKTPLLNILNSVYADYKNYQPKYMKNYSLKDLFEIIWYSFFLKDLTLLVNWFCRFMESINFKFHKKFIIFLQNFIIKNQSIFLNYFNINGFFFDIRGKVGVTGNSKKRHHFFKIGKINRSAKKKKFNFKQSLVRTPSGVLGVIFIISY